ncbi:MAG: galactokinase [Granulosicoccus sp.]
MWQQDLKITNSASIASDINPGGSTTQAHGDTSGLPEDIQIALQLLTRQIADSDDLVTPHFDTKKPLMVGRAPARLDVMGGISDYSGSTVLQLPLKESAVVFCQRSAQATMQIISVGSGGAHDLRSIQIPLEDFYLPGTSKPCSYSQMRDYFAAKPEDQRWAAYFAGVLTVLMIEFDLTLEYGIVLYGHSKVPEGKGVSSSAAIEVATMRSVTRLMGLDIDAHQQAVLCQQVENLIVGAPCGLMDQMASSMGQKDALLNMLCQPDIVGESLQLPDGLSVWGIDSGLRHAVSGADYGAVRVASFMGYRLLLEQAGIASHDVAAVDIDDKRWNGYLANVSVSEFSEYFASQLPSTLSGEAFLGKFDGITDTVTRVDPAKNYAVLACTSHPIQEHFRVRVFMQLCRAMQTEKLSNDSVRLMGECMYMSHASYTHCGLGSTGTDDLVERLRRVGAEGGIYGARISGGGNGGTVAVLADAGSDSVIRTIAADYARASGIGGQVFSGSSAGASSHVLLHNDTH